ncbi:hypothetical protein ACC699_29770 [Rhizobium ruizarguesonis]|uniref:hypothetical protein n=1 Tax=Rhizobium ruizarguesonis TaxID=2081791 RepID=UPI0013DF5713|nr:hypothetical protein [Rhizobium ruizarguesonis]MBY5853885.1 hypothetical protein [Rhizobium leguminosarum]QND41157.1 hypothetical protein HB771_36965 [Rhizobium leguminosarum bv. viciae]
MLDDLWAWQAETWADFAVLAIVLAFDELEESELVAQSRGKLICYRRNEWQRSDIDDIEAAAKVAGSVDEAGLVLPEGNH